MTNKELIEQLQNDREIPILVMVEDDVICGDWVTYSAAQINTVKKEKVFFHNDPTDETPYRFYDEYDKPEWKLYDELWDIIGEEKADNMSYKELLQTYEELPWRDVIVIYVGGVVDDLWEE